MLCAREIHESQVLKLLLFSQNFITIKSQRVYILFSLYKCRI